jgi:hypothetical protein
MSRLSATATCPHCGESLRAIQLPRETNYDEPVHWVCFNNACPYYREGWEWMRQQFEVKASYRYRVDPSTGAFIPLPVWSDDALLDRLVDEGDRVQGDHGETS